MFKILPRLCLAAHLSNDDEVRALIDAGSDVNKSDGDGKTALFYAVKQSNNENVVHALIGAGADVNKSDGDGKTALFYAVQQSNNENVVHALIGAGADVNKSDGDRKTALFYAVQQSSNENVVRALIVAGVDVNKSDGDRKTALFYAVQQSNNENVVRALIGAGVDVNKSDGDRTTALFYAVQQSDNENVVRALIDAGSDVLRSARHGKTALFYAVQQSNNENVVRALIDAGGDVNKTDGYGKTALFYAVQQSNNENVVRALIGAGVDVNKSDGDRTTALFYAVQQSDNKNVVRALIDTGVDVNKTACDRKTALFYAVQQSNNENVVRALIDTGVDVNKTACDGKTALFYAVQQSNNENVVRALIDAGSDVNKSDGDGKTALFYAVQQSNNKNVVCALIGAGVDVNKSDGYGKTALFYALQKDNNGIVVCALINAGVDVNKTYGDGKTALFYALQHVQDYNGIVVHALIIAGSDVNETDGDGKSALFYAVQQSSNENGVHALIAAGSDVNGTDSDGKTALFYAVQQSSNENVVHALIVAGSDVNGTDSDGKTALFYAVQQSNNENVVHALIDAGVDVNKTDGDGKTALFYAVQQSNNENVVCALVDAGTDLNKIDHEGQTALFYALQQNDNENVVCTLISAGNDSTLSIKDRYGRTPLFYAWKCPTTLSYLPCKERIHYPYLKDNCNISILTFFQEQFALSSALSFERCSVMPEIIDLLMKHGVNEEKFAKVILNLIFSKIPNTLVRDETVSSCTMVRTLTTSYAELIPSNQLMKVEDIKMIFDCCLIKDKILEVLELLLELGADPNSADSQGNNALHYVTRLPLFDIPQGIVMDMLYKLDELRTSLDFRNHEGQNPLLFCLSGYVTHTFLNENQMLLPVKALVDVCTFLVKRGCNIQETMQSGESVGHLLMKLLQKCLKVPDQTLRNDILHEAIKLVDLFALGKAVKAKLGNKTDFNLNSPLHLWASFELPSPQDYTSNITRDHTFETFLKQILQSLLKCGAKLNARNENEETPLHLCRTWSAVKLLLDAGANPKDVDSSGRSTLLVAAKNKMFLKNHDDFYPDITVDQNYSFWKIANEKGLDLWTVDNNSDSVLSCLIQSESYLLAKALVKVACEGSDTLSEMIFSSLLNAICKDKSTSTQWKVILIKDLLRFKKSPSSVSKALHFCCENLIAFSKTTDAKALRSRKRYAPVYDDEARKGFTNDSAMQNSVHFEIAKLLLWSGADPGTVDSSGKSCLDIAETCPELKDLLTKPVDINSISLAIPWTSVSKKFEGRLAKVARLQEYEIVDSIWYHKECIGSGSFGHVFAGINNKDGGEVAMKRIETLRMNRPEDKREITNLTMLADCKQVVRYLYFIEKGDFSFIVLELMEGNLDDMFKQLCHLSSVTELCNLCKDVVMGVKFLHERNIIHRDLKPSNILYKYHPKLCLKIADFGLSLCMDSIGKTTVYGTNAGTRCWIAPEALKSANHTKSSDMFSCGLLLHYILSLQKHPFSPVDIAAKNEIQIAYETETNVVNGKIEGWDTSLSPETTALVGRMLANEDNIIDRPAARDALHHPLFWPKEKKIDLLIAVGNQPEFECPRAKRTLPLTAVETDLEKNFSAIVGYRTWNDPGYTNMPAIYTEMTPPRRRTYDTSSVVELVRFIRNAYNHVSEDTRPTLIRKMLLEDFVFLEYYPQLVMEVYTAVTTHGWNQTKEEVKYAMNK